MIDRLHQVVGWMTLPGIVAHEWGHVLACRLTATRVLRVCYVRTAPLGGFVQAELPSARWKCRAIAWAPLPACALLTVGLGLAAARLAPAPGRFDVLSGMLLWLAVSAAMHGLPSPGDRLTCRWSRALVRARARYGQVYAWRGGFRAATLVSLFARMSWAAWLALAVPEWLLSSGA